MNEKDFGLALVKQEGHSFCGYCHADAAPGEELMHEPWCPPPEPPKQYSAWSNIWPFVLLMAIAVAVSWLV
jgi:hypothetical protein